MPTLRVPSRARTKSKSSVPASDDSLMLPGARRPARRTRRTLRWASLVICAQIAGLVWLAALGESGKFKEDASAREVTVVLHHTELHIANNGSVLDVVDRMDGARHGSLTSAPQKVRFRWEPRSICAIDQQVGAATGGDGAAPQALAGSMDPKHNEERFLVYSPQFGLSNQIVALRNAAGWASLLNRTLVVPHLVNGPPHAASLTMIHHGALFDMHSAARRLAPALRVVEMRDFLGLGLTPARLVQLSANTKFSVPSYDYLDAIGLSSWHNDGSAPPLNIAMSSFIPSTIRGLFAGCTHHRLLAFVSLFGAFDPKPLSKGPGDWMIPAAFGTREDGIHFLDTRAMPSLLTPNKPVARLVEEIVAFIKKSASPRMEVADVGAMRRRDASAEGASSVRLACVHVRRGDFHESCMHYEEEARSGRARQWVVSHFERGFSCWQTDAELELNLQLVRANAAANGNVLAFYGSSDEPKVFTSASLHQINVSKLQRWASRIQQLESTVGGVIISSQGEVQKSALGAIIDQLVCSRASYLLLNIFSTFSQMVIAHIGVRHSEKIGFVRDLTLSQQGALGVHVDFWRRQNPFDETKLLGVSVVWDNIALRMNQAVGIVPETEASTSTAKSQL